MSDIRQISGGVFSDYRGKLIHFNEFDFQGVHRYYFLKHSDINVVRGWHGHQFEKKWFQCIQGSFVLGLVKVDNWEFPSSDLQPEVFYLSEQDPLLICVPEGYANCIRALQPNSTLLVYSGKPLEKAKLDSWRWPFSMWGGDKL